MVDLYCEHILDHGRNPRNWTILQPADVDYETNNPLCGDNLRLTLRIDEQQNIIAVGWSGTSCAISQAAASMLGLSLVGVTVSDARAIGKQRIFDMLGVPLTTNRIKCALLPLKALIVALYGLDEWQQHESADE